MGLIAQLRTSLENPSTPLSYPAEWLLDIFNGGRTDTGIRVSEKTALQVTTIFACVQLISGAVGSPDLNVYERIFAENKRAGKRIAYEHSLFDLLENEPNDEMSSFTFRTTLQAHALLWGNLYAEIQRDNGNRILAIWPRNPSRTRPFRLMTDMVIQGERLPKGSLVYKTTEGAREVAVNPESPNDGGSERVILKEDMIHIPGLALDGRLGARHGKIRSQSFWQRRRPGTNTLASRKAPGQSSRESEKKYLRSVRRRKRLAPDGPRGRPQSRSHRLRAG
jgi:hypothetical protein